MRTFSNTARGATLTLGFMVHGKHLYRGFASVKIMNEVDEIKTLLYMDKTPDEIITLGYSKDLVLEIFEREFVNRLEEAGFDIWEPN